MGWDEAIGMATLDEVVAWMKGWDGVTDSELIHHEKVRTATEFEDTLWLVHNDKIVCVLLAGDDDGWAYKLIVEYLGPTMINCPLRMLEAVPMPADGPPTDGWARQWRLDVLKYHRVKKDDRSKYMRPA